MAVRAMSLLPSIFFAMIAVASRSVNGGDEADALLAFKAEVGGQGSGALALWNGRTGFCSWKGVTCRNSSSSGGRSGLVVALSLPSLGLTGTLSPAVGNLTSLRALDLSSNWLHGSVPTSLGRLRRLRALDLSGNAFSGTLPANLTSCISLTSLVLDGNSLTGRIPIELGDTLRSLEFLQLRNNSFTGPIPASLANLTSLRYLYLGINKLEGPIPPGLGDISGLRRLDLFMNNLSGELPQSLYNLSSLRTFQIGHNILEGSIAADIGDRFPNVTIFGLSFNRFHGHIPSSLSNLSSISTLNLAGNRFSGHVPADLGRLQSLVYLDMFDNRLEADNNRGWEFITSLANCSHLQELTLSRNSFSGQLPSSIVNLSSTLQTLYLGDNSISGSIPAEIGNLVGLNMLAIVNTSLSGAIPESIGKLTNLVHLGLYNNSLSGPIPPSIGNLTNLNKLVLYLNSLEGPIPRSLGRLKNLVVLDLSINSYLNGSIPKEILQLSLSWFLDLSYNSLSGPLPSEVGTLANLNWLSLSGNHLSGELPDNIKNCAVLEFLFLDNNLFQGNIPQSLKDIKGLRVLNLTMNKLSGRIPDAVGSIRNLQELYLAHNNLSGPIPAALQNLTLSELDVSYNNLQGQVPKDGVFGNLTYSLVAGNDDLCGGIPQLHLAPCSVGPMRKNRGGWSKSLIIAVATIGAILFFVLVLICIWLICNKLKRRKTGELLPLAFEEQYERISYYALSKGTDGFSEANLLGRGSYGAVYKCTLQNENTSTTTAVKVFNLQMSGSSRSFLTECEALSRVRHRCLTKIITCCSSIDPQGQEFKALVFEFMPHGSLEDWLHQRSARPAPSNALSLAQRLDIAVDVADALEYLHSHCQPPIIHCDIKPSNILLADDMSARVGDFGISRILPENTSTISENSFNSNGIRGSIGYVAPEYGEGCAVSTSGDVYSFGTLLLEMFTGRSPTDDMFKDSLDLHKFAEIAIPDRAMDIADPTIWPHGETTGMDAANASMVRRRMKECLVSVIGLAVSCSKQHPRERLVMGDAAAEMRAIRDAHLRFAGYLIR